MYRGKPRAGWRCKATRPRDAATSSRAALSGQNRSGSAPQRPKTWVRAFRDWQWRRTPGLAAAEGLGGTGDRNKADPDTIGSIARLRGPGTARYRAAASALLRGGGRRRDFHARGG